MLVTYDWTDGNGDNYTISAEVSPVDYNRVSIVNILTPDNVDVDFDDFDDDEKRDIRWGAKEAARELDKFDNDDDDEDDDDDTYDRSDEELDLY